MKIKKFRNKIINLKRDENDYISTKDILDIIEKAICEYKQSIVGNLAFGDNPIKTTAISGQDLRGVKNV